MRSAEGEFKEDVADSKDSGFHRFSETIAALFKVQQRPPVPIQHLSCFRRNKLLLKMHDKVRTIGKLRQTPSPLFPQRISRCSIQQADQSRWPTPSHRTAFYHHASQPNNASMSLPCVNESIQSALFAGAKQRRLLHTTYRGSRLLKKS